MGSVLAGRRGQSVGAGGASCCGCVLGLRSGAARAGGVRVWGRLSAGQ